MNRDLDAGVGQPLDADHAAALATNNNAPINWRSKTELWWLVFGHGLLLLDMLLVMLSGMLVQKLQFGTFMPDHVAINFLLIYGLALVIALKVAGSYRRRALCDRFAQLDAVIKGATGGLLITLIVVLLSGETQNISRVWMIGVFILSIPMLLVCRICAGIFVGRMSRAGVLAEKMVLVGAGDRADLMVEYLKKDPDASVRILGIFDDRFTRIGDQLAGIPHLGSIDDLVVYARVNAIDRVVVCLPWSAADRLFDLLNRIRTVPVAVYIVPHLICWNLPALQMERICGIPMISVANRKVGMQIGWLKRIEDLLISGSVFLLIWPILLLIAVLVKLDSPGPVIFRQNRHGFNNVEFQMFKFRSMHVHQPEGDSIKQATVNDPRVTRVGRWLRKTSLDELPQLLNVIRGDMSIVGPRPHAIQHNEMFSEVVDEFYARHNIKPGITGWAQVNGFRGETDTTDKVRMRVDYDLYYMDNWSVFFDLKIVVLTAFKVWSQKNAY